MEGILHGSATLRSRCQNRETTAYICLEKKSILTLQFTWMFRSTLGQLLTQIRLVRVRNHAVLSSWRSTTKPHYSREQLLSIRPNCYSTKWLSPVLLHHLKDLNILKYRGKAGARQFSGKTLESQPFPSEDKNKTPIKG